MAGPINTSTFFQSNSKVLKAVYVQNIKKVPPLYQEIFNTLDVDMKRPFYTALPIIELGPLAVKTEGQSPVFDQAFEGIPTTFLYQTFALAYKITEEAELEDALSLIKRLPGMLAYSEQITKDLLFWQLFNLAFTAGVNGSDGVPLVSAAHPLGVSGQTFSNSGALTALSPESLQAAFISFHTMLSDRTNPMYKTPKHLVIPPQLQKIAEEILGSQYYPYSGENRKNVVERSVTPLVSRYLTSPTAWFVLAGKGDIEGDSHSLVTGFKWQNRQRTWTDEATGNMNHRTSFRTTFGFLNWRGFWGSQGS
jgi:hypothetical protein